MAAMLLTGCEADDTDNMAGNGLEAIAFDARTEWLVYSNRASNTVDDHDGLASGGGFGVFGCYTGLHKYRDSDVQSDFMYNQHLTYDDVNHVWTYDPIKYWPNGEGEATDGQGEANHYVSFFAYAPYSNQMSDNPAGYCIPTFNLQHEKTNPWLTYRLHTDVDQQVDLMYAVPLMDRTKMTPGERLTFSFRHALACVGDRVTVAMHDDLKEVYKDRVVDDITHIEVQLKSVAVTYRLTERARLVLWTGGEANWQALSSGEALTTRTVVLKEATDLSPHLLYSYDSSLGAGGSNWTDSGHGVFYIPIEREEAPQTAQVTVTYDVITTNGSGTVRIGKSSTTTLKLSNYAEAYQAGRGLNLNMRLVNEV